MDSPDISHVRNVKCALAAPHQHLAFVSSVFSFYSVFRLSRSVERSNLCQKIYICDMWVHRTKHTNHQLKPGAPPKPLKPPKPSKPPTQWRWHARFTSYAFWPLTAHKYKIVDKRIKTSMGSLNECIFLCPTATMNMANN